MRTHWTTSLIRQRFLDYFQSKGHTVVESSSLVPDDPTLLFTNAGMVQFKKLFLGLEKRSYTRLATAQKCMRVSGKHNDLENVGPSPRHHTFFEMLGNFSFGDYFKRDAISYAWELLTEVYGLDRDRFHFTVYKDDEESFQLWQEIAQAPQERIHSMGEQTNFWMMGETGPCGPNTELIWDRGPEFCDCDAHSTCSPHLDNDCNRWCEVWNLVFMQFNQDESGQRTPLPQPGVDTGLGLERLVSVLQNGRSNYETDLFQPILEDLRRLTGQSEAQMRANFVPYRVIADHGRAMTFLSADGVLPSNEKQGYVLRMIMRRAIRFGKKLGLPPPFLPSVAQTVIETMGDHYTELQERKDFILKAIVQEEERFERTLDQGLERVEKIIAELKRKNQNVISGPEAFFLHDTYGFPVEMLEDIAREHGMQVDRAGFARAMEQQRERSRSIDTSASITARSTIKARATVTRRATEFVGYSSFECESTLLDREENLFVFRETPFYTEAGGQVADTGWIGNRSRPGRAEVLDVQKNEHGVYLHRVKVLEGSFEQSDRCLLKVNAERRQRTMRNHTATHILHAALRRVLGYSQGIQAGSLVAPDELRFDFKHLAPLTPEEIAQIEELANRAILGDLPVTIAEEPIETAKTRGAMALFTEDYAGKEKVRVVTIAPLPGEEKPFSVELCGGTHVQRSTGQIGLFKILSEQGVAAGVRRVHVAVSENLLKYLSERERTQRQLAQALKTSDQELLAKVEALLQEKEQLARERDALKQRLLINEKERLLAQRQIVNGVALICARLDLAMDDLKLLSDLIEPEITPGVALLGGTSEGKAALVCKVSEQLTKRIHASQIIKTLTPLIGGGGGGSPRFAQGGGSSPNGLDEALRQGTEQIRAKAR